MPDPMTSPARTAERLRWTAEAETLFRAALVLRREMGRRSAEVADELETRALARLRRVTREPANADNQAQ